MRDSGQHVLRPGKDDALKKYAKYMDESDGDGERSLNALSSLWLTGSKEGSYYCGAEAQALPHLRLQAGKKNTRCEGVLMGLGQGTEIW